MSAGDERDRRDYRVRRGEDGGREREGVHGRSRREEYDRHEDEGTGRRGLDQAASSVGGDVRLERKRYRSPLQARSDGGLNRASRIRRSRSLEVTYQGASRKEIADAKFGNKKSGRGRTEVGGRKQGKLIDARDSSFRSSNRKINNESGYGSGVNTPREASARGGFRSSRGGGGGGHHGFYSSTPLFGRGGQGARQPDVSVGIGRGGGGGAAQQDVRGGGGRANDFLADKCIGLEKCIADLEEENKILRAGLPKAATVHEMENLKKKLSLANGKIEKLVAKQYKHICIEGGEAKILDKCSDRVKKFIKHFQRSGFDEKDIKHGMQLLFHKLTSKAAWEEIVRMVRSIDDKKAVEGLVKGLSEYLQEESEEDVSCDGLGDSQDMFASGEEDERSHSKDSRAGGRKISVSGSDSDDNVEIGQEAVPRESKNQLTRPKIRSTKKGVKSSAGSSGVLRAADNRKNALAKLKVTRGKKQAKDNEKTFDDEASENLDRQYNEQVLRRKGSPDISSKKGTPAAPRKVRDKTSKSAEEKKGKGLAKDYAVDDKTVHVRFTFGAMVIKGELGKLYNLAEVQKKSDQGGRVLDKNASELVTTFKCGFWPVCDGGVSSLDTLVRGGLVEKPVDHNKVGQLVYICGEHSGQQVVDEVPEDIVSSGDSSLVLKESKLCMNESGLEVGEEENEALVEDSGDVETGGQEEEVLQSQSLLAGKK